MSTADVDSGRAAKGYTCNTALVSHYGASGGFRVHRYVDPAGHECAYYDTTQIFPVWNLRNYATPTPDRSAGVFVLDMSDPLYPVHTDTLLTPAMLSPHESLNLHAGRGLLIAAMGATIANPGFVDIYDVSQDCRHSVLKSSSPLAVLGHEGALAPDGNTFYVSSTGAQTITAVDISDPGLPKIVWVTTEFIAHGMNVSDDGNRLYVADIADYNTSAGLTILDVSQVQQRVINPSVLVVSKLSWPEVSIPQTAIPVTIAGHRYVIEIDEFTRQQSSDPAAQVGAARIVDIADDTKPKVVSNIRLEVNMPEARLGDSQNDPQGRHARLHRSLLRRSSAHRPGNCGVQLHPLGASHLRHPGPAPSPRDRVRQLSDAADTRVLQGERVRHVGGRLRPRAGRDLVYRRQQRLLCDTSDQRRVAVHDGSDSSDSDNDAPTGSG